MPHSPVSMTSRITHTKSPLFVSSKTVKLKIRTSVVWKHITRNCVVTCDARISTPVTPDTKHRSRMPSLRSINIAPDVKATDKKKMILENKSERRKKIREIFLFFSSRVWDIFGTLPRLQLPLRTRKLIKRWLPTLIERPEQQSPWSWGFDLHKLAPSRKWESFQPTDYIGSPSTRFRWSRRTHIGCHGREAFRFVGLQNLYMKNLCRPQKKEVKLTRHV